MAWTPGIPALTQKISASTNPIEQNFAEILADFGTNHVDFQNAVIADRGKHNIVTLPRQGAAPAPFAANEIGLYNILNATTGLSELYFRKDGAAIAYPMTAKSVPGVSAWTYLASGLVIKYGTNTTNGAGLCVINLDTIGPVYTSQPRITLTVNNNTTASYCLAFAFPLGFVNLNITSNLNSAAAGGINFNWMAIGPV